MVDAPQSCAGVGQRPPVEVVRLVEHREDRLELLDQTRAPTLRLALELLQVRFETSDACAGVEQALAVGVVVQRVLLEPTAQLVARVGRDIGAAVALGGRSVVQVDLGASQQLRGTPAVRRVLGSRRALQFDARRRSEHAPGRRRVESHQMASGAGRPDPHTAAAALGHGQHHQPPDPPLRRTFDDVTRAERSERPCHLGACVGGPLTIGGAALVAPQAVVALDVERAGAHRVRLAVPEGRELASEAVAA